MGLITKSVTPIAKSWQTQRTAYLISIYPFFFTSRSLIFWEWQYAQLKYLPPRPTCSTGQTLLFTVYLSEVTGLLGKFSKGYGQWAWGFALCSSCLEWRCHPGSAAAVFPSSGWTQDVKDGRVGRQGVYVLSSTFSTTLTKIGRASCRERV